MATLPAVPLTHPHCYVIILGKRIYCTGAEREGYRKLHNDAIKKGLCDEVRVSILEELEDPMNTLTVALRHARREWDL